MLGSRKTYHGFVFMGWSYRIRIILRGGERLVALNKEAERLKACFPHPATFPHNRNVRA